MNFSSKYYIYLIFTFIFLSTSTAQTISDLRSRGYVMFPTPQKVELTNENVRIDENWQLKPGKKVPENIINNLKERSASLYNLEFASQSSKSIVLSIDGATVKVDDPECSEQAYRITISSDKVLIEGNSHVGLFYGIQSFLQLLKPTSDGTLNFPVGVITDWPDLELRFIHWDTKHHRDKVGTLKRYIDWLAYFKVNAIAFEIEDKYEYPSHPVIGSPDAFTKEEMRELTQYALDRYIQLVPNVQAPAHMAYVLKHQEFEHLRAESESNYQACMCEDEAMELIFDMYQDMIDATPGVDYFFVSTDEVYYAGICDKCKFEYNDENRSKIWVDYLQKVSNWMKDRDRRVLAWVEYPLLPKDISKVPGDVIDAIMGPHKNEEWTSNETKAGLEQLSYSSMQGSEYLFPNYFLTTYRGRQIEGRLNSAHRNISEREQNGANLIGTFAAAWDDAGLHNETFWLGWATVTQYAWSKSTPSLQQNIVDFMDLYYGKDSPDMIDIYMGLQEGARFYEDLWDRKVSVEREKGYGNSKGKGIGGDMVDLVLDLPEIPKVTDLSFEPTFKAKYKDKIEEASRLLKENEGLTLQLTQNITRVRHNSYNLEVLLSIAFLEKYTLNFVLNLARIERYLELASKEADDEKAVALLVDAYKVSEQIMREQEEMWTSLTVIWEKSRLPKGATVDGKEFYHVYDDVKDHFADRRKGLEYMLAPFERTGVEDWKRRLEMVINEFADAHGIEIEGLEEERLED